MAIEVDGVEEMEAPEMPAVRAVLSEPVYAGLEKVLTALAAAAEEGIMTSAVTETVPSWRRSRSSCRARRRETVSLMLLASTCM